jgi:hypothetical protein
MFAAVAHFSASGASLVLQADYGFSLAVGSGLSGACEMSKLQFPASTEAGITRHLLETSGLHKKSRFN